MDNIPLWALFLFTLTFAAISVEVGFRVGVFRHGRGALAESGSTVQATLALLAFFLAFTFGIAAERFNDRRVLIIEEANAIGTTYLRSGFLPEVAKNEVRRMLRDYVALRMRRAKDAQELQQFILRSEKIQDQLWDKAIEFGKADLNSDIGALFVESLNETIDLQSTRVAASLYARIPVTVWYALYAMIFLGLASIGYQEGVVKTRNWLTTSTLLLSFAMVVLLIADLDRPSEGFLKTNLQMMRDLGGRIGVAEIDDAGR